MSGLAKEVLYGFLGQAVAKLETVKAGNQKKVLDLLGSRLLRLRLYIVNRCSPDGPGSIPGRRKLCWLPVLQPFGVEEPTVLLLKDLNHIY